MTSGNRVPKVTVVTPSHNSSRYIEETIRSVRAQTFSDWEQIIVDDCSTDNTRDIVRKIAQDDPRIKLIELSENTGPANARNVAIRAARGRYIAFLDSDDKWYEEKLERQLEFMEAGGIAFSYTSYVVIDESGKKAGTRSVPETLVYTDLLKQCKIGCLTAIYDTSAFGKVEMPLIRKRQDLGLWLKLLKTVDSAHGLTEQLASYRQRSDSVSANKLIAAKYTWRLYRDFEKLNLAKSLFFFAQYAYNGIFRRND